VEETTMDWSRILTPVTGGEGDRRALAAACRVAEAFGAELAAVYAPADLADLIPWMGDGYMGGIQPAALDSLRDAATAGERVAKEAFDACAYAKKRFVSLVSPVWAGLAMESRLSDLVVFDDPAARGKGPLAEPFRQIVADEQRPTLVARAGFRVGGVVAVAWDGGKEATRAVRTSLPLMEKAASVVILHAPGASPRKSDPADLQRFLETKGVGSSVQVLADTGDAGPGLVRAAKAASADLLVAGAFGHPRLQEFIFGGATRTFLNADAPSLFLSH
jgi:nucleotide-binding universal stress UspA family protein